MSILRTRALVFSTFFGSVLAIGLLLVSFTTNQWIKAYPRRLNSTDSTGEVSYGLFYGNKDLNQGFGVRSHTVNVYEFIQAEEGAMNFWLWLITALGTGFGLLSSAIAAIASVLKAASATKKPGSMVLLFASNISSVTAQVIAFICWLVQFYQYLKYNVLTVEDKNRHWYTGLAQLGYSFYLLIASTLVVLLNIVILLYAMRSENRNRRRMEPLSEYKNHSAIMLY